MVRLLLFIIAPQFSVSQKFCIFAPNFDCMRKFNILVLLCLFGVLTVFAQEDKTQTTEQKADTVQKKWKFDGVMGLNAGATSLVFWTGGGHDNANALTYAKLHLLYYKNNIAWESNFDSDFGLTWIDQEDDRVKKSSDDIKFSTKLGWEFKKDWFLTALGSFQSQYAIGRDYKQGKYDPVISKWLCPSKTEVSLGIDWKKSVGGCDFSVYISPIAGTITTAYVSDATNIRFTEEYLAAMEEAELPIPEDYNGFRQEMQIKYGTYKIVLDNDGYPAIELRNCRAEFGLSLKGSVAYKYKNLTIVSSLWLFTPYQGKGFDMKAAFEEAYPDQPYELYYQYSNLNRHFGRFDVDWDFLISYNFLKVLNVTFSTNMKFYNGTLIKDQNGVAKDRVQFKSVLGVGLGYSF